MILNGVGATLESFYKCLREMQLTNGDFYFVANCTLHDLQRVMASPMERVFGLGGKEKYNATQLLHSISLLYTPDHAHERPS